MQKTTMFKRIMTLFLVFVMVLGILPISEFVSPAIAAEAKAVSYTHLRAHET